MPQPHTYGDTLSKIELLIGNRIALFGLERSMSDTFDLAHCRRLAFDLVEAHVRVVACKEQVHRAYPHVPEADAALSEARVHLVQMQRRFDQIWTTSARTSAS